MTRFEKWSVVLSSALTVLTGLAFLGVKYLMEPAEPWAVINHPSQPWLQKAHILVSPLLVFSVGAIAVRHVWRHFRAGRAWARKSGLGTAAAVAPMVLTGYLVQAITHVGWLRAMAISHIVFSLLYTAAFAAHYLVTRRMEQRGKLTRQTRRVRLSSERAHVAHRPRGVA